MTAVSQSLIVQRYRALPAIFWGGLIAGALDLIYAFIFYGLRGISPMRIMQSIASGLLGADSYRGGVSTAVLGVMLHFLILFVAAALYYGVSRQVGFLVRRAVVCGLLYGVAIFLFMNFVVVPLSAFPHESSYPFVAVALHLSAHMFLVGLPIALAVRRNSK